MGLYERTRNVLGDRFARLLAELSRGDADPVAFERALLALDAHRRETEHSLLRQQALLDRLRERLSAARTELTRWQERERLALRYGREELAAIAAERRRAAHAHTEHLRAESRRLQEAIARLAVARERIEQALRRLRRHEHPPVVFHDVETEPTQPAADDDAIELAFVELELRALGDLPGPGGASERGTPQPRA